MIRWGYAGNMSEIVMDILQTIIKKQQFDQDYSYLTFARYIEEGVKN